MDSLGRREGGTRPASRRYADPTSFLMPAQRWAADREELAVTFGRPLDATRRLAELEADQHAQLQRLQAAIDAGDGVRLHAGRVVIDPVTADPVDAGTQRLATELTARLPRLELTELLLDVDAWTQSSTHLTHAAGATPQMSQLAERQHAAVIYRSPPRYGARRSEQVRVGPTSGEYRTRARPALRRA